MTEGRIASTEIVERQADTTAAQLLQGVGNRLRIRHQHALGQLENQGLRVEAGGVDRLHHLGDELGTLQLAAG